MNIFLFCFTNSLTFNCTPHFLINFNLRNLFSKYISRELYNVEKLSKPAINFADRVQDLYTLVLPEISAI